jgi:hypothetical protein
LDWMTTPAGAKSSGSSGSTQQTGEGQSDAVLEGNGEPVRCGST